MTELKLCATYRYGRHVAQALRPLKNSSIVIASEASRLRHSSLWLRRLKAISKHVDNPQDCHVALLLAMTRIEQKWGLCKALAFRLAYAASLICRNGINFAYIYGLMHYNRIIHIILLAVVLFLAFSVSPCPAQDVPSQHEQDLLQLINEARENPLIVATSLGMDADQILQDLPELRDILIYGLPPLSFNENLYAAASAHTRDMLENGYYSHDSLDGRTYDDRIGEKGYVPTATGESLGMLAFFNFIQPAEAVALIFENMFRYELDPARTERRNILASDLKEAGIALRTGTLVLSGSACNVYLATCDFGSSVRKLELEFFNLINQARENPLAVAESLGMDPDQIMQDFPELRDILIYGLPPLTFNRNLYAAAGAHSQDMLENGYYSHFSLDGRTFEDRIRETGYDLLDAGENMALQCLSADFIDENDDQIDRLVSLMFRKIFTRELRPDSAEERNILDPVLREVGISFITGTSSELGGICGDRVSLLVADFGFSFVHLDPSLVGVVYSDRDQDGLYSQGEGIPGVAMSIDGPSGFLNINIYTNKTGGFSAALAPGPYRIVALVDGQEMIKYIELEEENQTVMFKVGPDSEEGDHLE